MPLRETNAPLTKLANALLQVLAQLSRPLHGVAIAHPGGKLLAANAQLASFWNAAAAPQQNPGTVQELLRLSEAEFAAITATLHQQRFATGELQPEEASAKPYAYCCRLVDYQGEVFMGIELSNADKPTALAPEQDDGYHHVFDGSTEPLFLIDSEAS